MVEPLAAPSLPPPAAAPPEPAVAVRVDALAAPAPAEPPPLPGAPPARAPVEQGAVVVVVVEEVDDVADDFGFDFAGCVVVVVVEEHGTLLAPRACVPALPASLAPEPDPVPWTIGLWAAETMAWSESLLPQPAKSAATQLSVRAAVQGL